MSGRRPLLAVLAHYVAAVALGVAGWLVVQAHGGAWLAALDEAGYTVERPIFVVVLLAIPLLLIIRAHTLSDLPRVQQALSFLLKAAFVAAIAASLVNLQEVEKEPAKAATVFVVDVSDSVPDAMLAKARDAVKAAWEAAGDNDVRLVAFAGVAREVPLPKRPGADAGGGAAAFPEIPRLTEGAAGQATDIEGGLRLAFTLLPEGRLPRVVLVTDGLETRGSAAAALETATRFGVPIHYEDVTDVPRPQELMVTELTVPDEIRPKVPFTAVVKVRTTAAMAARCELLIDGIVDSGQDVELERGESTVSVEATVREGGEKKLAAVCTPKDPADDHFASNNRFEIPVKVPERPKLLYVEGERSYTKNLAAAFSDDFDVEYRGARGVPGSLADANQFDLIFISDVPRTGDMGYENMTTTQMRALEQYARGGGGLVFAGGENSFGPGGYTQTYLERQVLPVWLDVQRKQDLPGVALMLVIDRSGSMTGPKIELAKQAAIATLNVLQPNDRLGIVAFDSRPTDLVKLQRASNRYKITESVSKLRSGGGTNVFAALDHAYNELVGEQAKVKHIILLTDGQSNRAGILELVSRSFEDKITISTVAVGMGADQELLKRIAVEGRGRYYFTNDAQNIPQLFLKETSEVSRRALVEDRFRPQVDPRFRHLQIFRGLDMAQAPSLIGYVSTRAKPRAEVIMTTHLGEPLLARWRLGLGKVVVWTSDVKNRWAHYWLSWGGYAKFWRQLVRDTMRVETEDPSYTMVADVADGTLTVGVDAVDDEDRFIEGVASDVTVVGPDGQERGVTLTQTAAGRYEGELALEEYGPYTIRGKHVPEGDPDATHQSFATVAWPFPPEHLVGDPDLSEVRRLAEATGGVKDPTPAQLFDVGDAHSEHRVPLWPLPLYAALGLLVLDVLLRRVRLYGKTQIAWQQVRGR